VAKLVLREAIQTATQLVNGPVLTALRDGEAAVVKSIGLKTAAGAAIADFRAQHPLLHTALLVHAGAPPLTGTPYEAECTQVVVRGLYKRLLRPILTDRIEQWRRLKNYANPGVTSQQLHDILSGLGEKWLLTTHEVGAKRQRDGHP